MWMKWPDIMLLSTGVNRRYISFIVHKTNRFSRGKKKLHIPPRTVGITADCIQYIIAIGLCRVCWLLVFVHWALWVKEWAIVTMLQAARYGFWTPVETCDISLLWMSWQAVGPPGLLFKGYGDSSLELKWPGCGVDRSSLFIVQRLRMSGAVPLLPHYAFMAWIRQLSLTRDSTVEGCNKPCL